MTYQFDIEHAEKYGVGEAILLNNFIFWITKNKANKKHLYEGRIWTYNSHEAFIKLFPFWTKRQIRTRIDSLVEQGVLIKGKFNKNAYDHTTWYAFEDEKSFLQKGLTDMTKKSDHKDQKVNSSIYTDNKPYNKPNIVAMSKNDIASFPETCKYIDQAKKLSQLLLDSICKWDQTHKYHQKKKPPDSWILEIERAMRLDHRSYEQLEFMINYLFTKSDAIAQFWSNNIQSGRKLREKFDRIKNQLKNKSNFSYNSETLFDKKSSNYNRNGTDDEKINWMTVYFHEKIRNRYGHHKSVKKATLQDWREPISMMIQQDDLSFEVIWKYINFALHDDFWKNIIKSTSGLHKNWEEIDASIRSEKDNNQPIMSYHNKL